MPDEFLVYSQHKLGCYHVPDPELELTVVFKSLSVMFGSAKILC